MFKYNTSEEVEAVLSFYLRFISTSFILYEDSQASSQPQSDPVLTINSNTDVVGSGLADAIPGCAGVPARVVARRFLHPQPLGRDALAPYTTTSY